VAGVVGVCRAKLARLRDLRYSHQVGAFSVTGQNYQATGAFAGKK